MSKKIFSAQDWENVPFENSVPTSPKLLPAPNSTFNNKEEEIERIICEIEQRALTSHLNTRIGWNWALPWLMDSVKTEENITIVSAASIQTIKGKKQTNNIPVACKPKDKA